jgi:S1-C subfamily serine protease
MAAWALRLLTLSSLLLAGCASSSSPAIDPAPRTHLIRPAATALSPQQAAELQTARQARRAAVVEIRTEFHEPPAAETASATVVVKESGGSGIAIDAGGLILTNGHVVTDATYVFVRVGDREYPAEQVAIHRELDLAMVRIAEPLQDTLQFRPGTVLSGQPVIAISGVPEQASGAAGVVTRNGVSLQEAIDPLRRLDYGNLIECTAALRPGFSGGPIVSETGEWLGISVAAAETPDRKEARGYALPLNERTRTAIAELRQDMTGPRATAGF